MFYDFDLSNLVNSVAIVYIFFLGRKLEKSELKSQMSLEFSKETVDLELDILLKE